MKPVVLVWCLLLLATASAQKRSAIHYSICPRPIDARLRDYLEAREVQPTITVNNVEDPGLRKPSTMQIPLLGHHVEWINTGLGDAGTTSVRIDGELIALKGRKSINLVDDTGSGDFDLVETWSQAKLYEVSGRTVIGIEMEPGMCTGLMCSVSFQLIYDVTNKTTSLFGTFRTDHTVNLYRLGNHDSIYYVGKTFVGSPNSTTPVVTEYRLYSFSLQGLTEVKSNGGKAYVLRHKYYEFELGKPQTLSESWIEHVE